MATSVNKNDDGKNTYLAEISDNLSNFIDNINCLRETYDYIDQMLQMQIKSVDKQYDDLVQDFPLDENGEIIVPSRQWRDFQRKERKKRRTERAMSLVPPSYMVSMVSLFDLFYAEIVRLIYRIAPEKLKESKKEFFYRDLCNFKMVQEVKTLIVEETIEGLMRESHVKQFDWLAKAMDVSTLKQFREWPDFVELTERRNLFVHSNGVVSKQYIDVCKNEGALRGGVEKGSKLTVDKEYFYHAYKILYIVGVKLTQMLAHTVYNKQFPNDTASIDNMLINSVYEMISDELYDVAISISEFALQNKNFVHNAKDKSYILLNFAQAYKWSGQLDKCQEMLDKEDCSAWKDELLIPKYALEGNFEMAYDKMKSIGKGNEVLTAENYRQWPIFKEIRKEPAFAKLFKEIFGEELDIVVPLKMGSKCVDETKTTTISSFEA